MGNKKDIILANARRSEIFLMLTMDGRINTKELAKEFGVTIKTIQKDIKLLKLGGLDEIIIEEKKKSGTYVLKENSKPPAIISLEEYFSTSIINISLLYPLIIKADELEKLEEENRKKLIETFVLLKPECKKIKKEKIHQLIRKIITKYPITITYKNRKGETKNYDVHPYKLILLGNYWYLAAKDINENRIKLFQADKIIEITSCSES